MRPPLVRFYGFLLVKYAVRGAEFALATWTLYCAMKIVLVVVLGAVDWEAQYHY
jgi:hypothetical protein